MANKLEDQNYQLIMQHILSPENSPLPPKLQDQLDRVLTAARLLDRNPDHTQIVAKMQAKYRIGRNTAYQDIRMATELYMNDHQFDYGFWKAWQIKDLLSCINECRLQNKHKEWIAAHKVLKQVIGEEPAEIDDARRAEKTNVYIQLNKNLNIPVDVVSRLNKTDLKKLSEIVYTDIDDEEAEEIMES